MYQYDLDISYNDTESYQAALLSLFNLTEYDNAVIQPAIDEMYDTMRENPEWIALLKELTGKHLLTYEVDMAIGLTLLLSYDYLELFHIALKQYHVDKTTNLHAIHALLNKK